MHKGTESGYHFWNLYQDCPRKFHLRHVLKLETEHPARPLLFGGAIHEGKAAFYSSKCSFQGMMRGFSKAVRDRQGSYAERREATEDNQRGRLLLSSWYESYGRDDARLYNVKYVEKELAVPLPNGFVVTARLDALVTRKKESTSALILETKTTGYSLEMTDQGVQFSDQATTYLWAAKRSFPKLNIEGLVPDIMYERKGRCECRRGDTVYRTDRELLEFEQGVMGILSEISQKVEALRQGWEWYQVFPRNTSWCTSFNRLCEYAHICREDFPEEEVPYGFIRSKGKEREIEQLKGMRSNPTRNDRKLRPHGSGSHSRIKRKNRRPVESSRGVK